MNSSMRHKISGGGGVAYSLFELLCVCVFSLTAAARDIYITPDADGTGDGSSWESPMMLTNYLKTANLKNGDIVRLKSGHYTAKIQSVICGSISGATAGPKKRRSRVKEGIALSSDKKGL